jgi:hypothetical protein
VGEDQRVHGLAADPADEPAKITVPVLILGGGNSPEWFKQTADVRFLLFPEG